MFDQRGRRKVSSCLGWEKASGTRVLLPRQGSALAGSLSAATVHSWVQRPGQADRAEKEQKSKGKRLR